MFDGGRLSTAVKWHGHTPISGPHNGGTEIRLASVIVGGMLGMPSPLKTDPRTPALSADNLPYRESICWGRLSQGDTHLRSFAACWFLRVRTGVLADLILVVMVA